WRHDHWNDFHPVHRSVALHAHCQGASREISGRSGGGSGRDRTDARVRDGGPQRQRLEKGLSFAQRQTPKRVLSYSWFPEKVSLGAPRFAFWPHSSAQVRERPAVVRVIALHTVSAVAGDRFRRIRWPSSRDEDFQ